MVLPEPLKLGELANAEIEVVLEGLRRCAGLARVLVEGRRPGAPAAALRSHQNGNGRREKGDRHGRGPRRADAYTEMDPLASRSQEEEEHEPEETRGNGQRQPRQLERRAWRTRRDLGETIGHYILARDEPVSTVVVAAGAVRDALEREVRALAGRAPASLARAAAAPLAERTLIGTPSEVRDGIARYRERLGMDLLVARIEVPSAPPAAREASLEWLAEIAAGQ